MSTTTAPLKAEIAITQKQQLQKRPKQQKLRLQQNQQLLLFGLTILIGIIILGPSGTHAAPLTGGGESTSFETKRRCSNTLSDAIREICGGRYFSYGQKYPNSVGTGRSPRSVDTTENEEDESYYRPLTTGPIHECCRRPCGYPDLKTYCATQD